MSLLGDTAFGQAVTLIRRRPYLVGVWWTGKVPGRGRPMYEDGVAPPVLQVLAAEDFAVLATSDFYNGMFEYRDELAAAHELRDRALAVCSMDELAALMAEGPPAVREAAILEVGRRAP